MNKNYRYFLMVAQFKNIKLSAEKLYISQPSLTAAIKKLESELDVTLFSRHSRGVELTEYGLLLRDHVQQHQEKHIQLLHQFSDLQQRKQGKLKLGTGEAWWEGFIKYALNTWQQEQTNASVHLEFGNNLALMDHLLSGDIDLFIGHEIKGLHQGCHVDFLPLFQDCEAYYVHSRHPLVNIENSDLTKQDSDYPLLRVTPDHTRHYKSLDSQTITNMTLNQAHTRDNRQVYEVDSLSASVDVLTMTDAIMPYTNHMKNWLSKRDIVTLSVNAKRTGQVGVYCKAHLRDHKIKQLIELVRQSIPNYLDTLNNGDRA